MINIEDLFNKAEQNIKYKSDDITKNELMEIRRTILREIEKINDELKQYKFASQRGIRTNVEKAFMELNNRMQKLNRGHSNKFVEDTITSMKIASKQLVDSEEKEQDEKNKTQNNIFEKSADQIGKSKNEKLEMKNDMYIEESVKEAYINIVKKLPLFGVTDKELDKVGEILLYSQRNMIKKMTTHHQENINSIANIVDSEIDKLQEKVKNISKSEKSENKNIEHDNIWKVENADEINRNAEKIAQKSLSKSNEPKKDKINRLDGNVIM